MTRQASISVCGFFVLATTLLWAQEADRLKAAKALEKAEPAKAVEIYREIIAKQGTDVPVLAEAYLRMGMSLAAMGHGKEAKEAIDKAMELCPGRPDFRALADVTLFRLQEGMHQLHRVEVDQHGRATFIAEMRSKNTTAKGQNTFGFHGNMGKLIEVRDVFGKKVPFWAEKRENGLDYTIHFDDPVPPGGEVYYQTVWEMERLVVRKEQKLLYHFGPHTPGPLALYEHDLVLPADSALDSTSPKPALVHNTDEGKVVTWQTTLQPGQSVELTAEFTIPNVDVFGLAIPDYFETVHKQSNVITIGGDGKVVARSESVERNPTVTPMSQISLSSGPRAKLVKVLDEQQNELKFLVTPMGERTMYMVDLHSAIPPGEERTFQSFFEIEGLVSREGDLWVYQYRHAPGPETLYAHTLQLPPDAEVVEAVPKPDDTAVVNGLKTLAWTSIVARGTFFSCRVKYRLGGAK